MIKGLIVSILVLVTFDGISCSCFFSPEEKWQKEMINSADVIFIGTARLDASVQNIIYLGSDSLVQIEQLIFEVNESFKRSKVETRNQTLFSRMRRWLQGWESIFNFWIQRRKSKAVTC
jgi:hypothetical protein